MIQFLMFVTPVIYPVSIVSNKWLQFILQLNPMATAIDLARGMFREEAVEPDMIFYGSMISLLLLLTGIFYFRKTESYFADLA
jgi:lipopolysaccharide transport system permease protein